MNAIVYIYNLFTWEEGKSFVESISAIECGLAVAVRHTHTCMRAHMAHIFKDATQRWEQSSVVECFV